MQTFIDFLVNNYLWFIIIALILVFALIGYLVDTSEKAKAQEELESEDLKEVSVEEPIKEAEPIESLNMDMGEGIQELEKEAIPIPNLDVPTQNDSEQVQPTTETTEVLEELE